MPLPAQRSGSAPPPLHQRKYTPHLYFSFSLREVIAAGQNVVVIVPQQSTENYLRKKMFRIYKENDNVRTLAEYDAALKDMLDEECVYRDLALGRLTKRYVFLKSEIDSGIVLINDTMAHYGLLSTSVKQDIAMAVGVENKQ